MITKLKRKKNVMKTPTHSFGEKCKRFYQILSIVVRESA